jgi:hypothetical protein
MTGPYRNLEVPRSGPLPADPVPPLGDSIEFDELRAVTLILNGNLLYKEKRDA